MLKKATETWSHNFLSCHGSEACPGQPIELGSVEESLYSSLSRFSHLSSELAQCGLAPYYDSVVDHRRHGDAQSQGGLDLRDRDARGTLRLRSGFLGPDSPLLHDAGRDPHARRGLGHRTDRSARHAGARTALCGHVHRPRGSPLDHLRGAKGLFLDKVASHTHFATCRKPSRAPTWTSRTGLRS